MQKRFKSTAIAAALRAPWHSHWRASGPVLLITAFAAPAYAIQIETDIPDLKIRLDNTVGYSLGFRTKSPSPALTKGAAAIGNDDGNLNFSDRGRPISNRVDLFTEADVIYRNIGARISTAAWYDEAYNSRTSNPSGLYPLGTTFNQARTLDNGAPGQFPSATAKQHGRKAELLDAFVFGNFDVGTVPVNVRLGRHALVWGESTFFGGNGIAGGMAPVDVVKLQSAPNATVKETTRPTNQISAHAVVTPGVSVAAYYQFSHEETRTAGSGSYFSALDATGVGAERSIVGIAGPPGFAVYSKLPDQKASDDGQGGLSVQFGIPDTDIDIGLHAIQYTAKVPVTYAYFAGFGAANAVRHTYQQVFPEKIRHFAGSFSTTVLNNVAVAGEVGIRTNVPLTRSLIIMPSTLRGIADGGDNTFFPKGKTAHINLSTTVSMVPNFIAPEAIFIGEVAWNRVLSCDQTCVNIAPGTPNGGLLGVRARDANAFRDAWGFRLLYVPTYRQVFSGVDLSVPIGLSYSPKGKSGAIGPLFSHKGGDISFGLTATVRSAYTVSIRYTHYHGQEKLPLDPAGNINFGQPLKDRNNIMLSARYSF